MKGTIEDAIKLAKTPGQVYCPVCGEGLFSPMDKLSIHLYEKCAVHLDDGGMAERNLLRICEAL